MDELKQSKVNAVFGLYAGFWNQHRGYRLYSSDTELYIMLENNKCLVISYYFVDGLEVEFRELTPEESNDYTKVLQKDFFNTEDDIYNYYTSQIVRKETCKLEYGSIVDVSLRSVTSDYNKWVDGDIKVVHPTAETFDEIKFTMSSGKSFIICADDAEADGYALLWSEDTEETITEISEDA